MATYYMCDHVQTSHSLRLPFLICGTVIKKPPSHQVIYDD